MFRSAGSVGLVALALVAAGCGMASNAAEKESPTTCLLRLQATARADTVIALYRRGALGSRARVEKFAGQPLPFVDGKGKIIPYDRMSDRQALRMDGFALKVTGMNTKVLIAVRDAVGRARAEAQNSCK